MSDLVGKILENRYRVDQFLGRGGMADVYKVWDSRLAAFLAMKLLHESLAEDQVFMRRFRREAQTLARLKHPHIVRFYELTQSGELIFMLMEYVDGVTLSKARSRTNKPFTAGQALSILQPVCSALHFAHQLGLIHCDIKPANIMIDRTTRVLLTDFGIARASEGATTVTMAGAGTPAYMSPEQVKGEDPSPETDIYALGVVLYELLTGGERPFTGENATITGTLGEKIRWEQRKLAPVSPRTYNPDISPEMEQVVLRCLAKDRRKRYASTTLLLQDLTKAANTTPESLPTLVFSKEQYKQAVEAPVPPARKRLSPLYFAAAGLAVAGFLGFLLLNGGTPRGAQAEAQAAQPAGLVMPSPIVVTQIVEVEVTATPGREVVQETNTPRPTAVPDLSVDFVHESSGYYIYVKGGPENYDATYGPVSSGACKGAPNDKFAVYVADAGDVYVIRYGDPTMRRADTLKNQGFYYLLVNENPDFEIDFSTDDNGTYRVKITERRFGNSIVFVLKRDWTL